MVDDLLSPQLDERRGRREMSETRSRVSTLLCKTFLQLEVGPDVQPAELREVWLIILDFMERLMLSGGKQDQMVRPFDFWILSAVLLTMRVPLV